MRELAFYRGKKVLITGHTGFKGAYLSRILLLAGADVTGYALDPPTDPSLFALMNLSSDMRSVTGDVRDFGHLDSLVREVRPDVVFHLAAQPIVRESYRIPRETFEINVMGTVNLLEALRRAEGVLSVVNVTTDKVYLNREDGSAYREDEPLNGYDPYSNSKSCSDLATQSYRSSFFEAAGVPVSTARAGNVIGGGDFAKDRLVPDAVRACLKGEPVALRNPSSVRPWQHVLEPLSAYLLLAEKQAADPALAGAWNVGPAPEDMVPTQRIAELFTEAWGSGASVTYTPDDGPHEASLLMLDSAKLRGTLGWKSRMNIEEAVRASAVWSKEVLRDGADARAVTDRQIRAYFER